MSRHMLGHCSKSKGNMELHHDGADIDPGHAEMDLNMTSAPLEKVRNDPALLG